jgi:histidinol dehydrogenase
MSIVEIGEQAAAKLAKAGVPVAIAEGFPLHARSMQARVGEAAAEGAVRENEA